jgi:peptidoglycan/LPS O-acetylase OafA/YrhL
MLKNPASLRPGRLWPNRLRRIIPAYWVSITLAVLIIGTVSGFQLRPSALKMAALAARLALVGFPWQPYLNGVTQVEVTGGIYWTLRMELLFYLLLPALVWFRKGWRVFLIFAVAAALNSASYHLHSSHGSVLGLLGVVQEFTHSLTASFSIGMLAAYRPWARGGGFAKVESVLKSPWSAAVGLLLLAIQMLWIKAGYSWYEPLLLAPIFVMVVAGNSFFGVLTSRPMRCLGQISYSVYIFHALILFTLTRAWNQWHPIVEMSPLAYWSVILVIGFVVAIICTFTYLFIERPFLSKRPAHSSTKLAELSGASKVS